MIGPVPVGPTGTTGPTWIVEVRAPVGMVRVTVEVSGPQTVQTAVVVVTGTMCVVTVGHPQPVLVTGSQ